MIPEVLVHTGRLTTSSATSDLENHMGGWMMGDWRNMMGGSGFWVFSLLGLLTWLLIIIALVLAIVWLFRQIQSSDKDKGE